MSTDADDGPLTERVAAQVIDLVLTHAFLLVAGAAVQFLAVGGNVIARTTPTGPTDLGGGQILLLLGGTLVVMVVFAAYPFVLEYVWDGRTVGKYLLGIRVVEADGAPPSAAAVVTRNVPVLAVPFAFPPLGHVLMLVVGLAAILRSDADQRLFDRLAGTYVVDDGADAETAQISASNSSSE